MVYITCINKLYDCDLLPRPAVYRLVPFTLPAGGTSISCKVPGCHTIALRLGAFRREYDVVNRIYLCTYVLEKIDSRDRDNLGLAFLVSSLPGSESKGRHRHVGITALSTVLPSFGTSPLLHDFTFMSHRATMCQDVSGRLLEVRT